MENRKSELSNLINMILEAKKILKKLEKQIQEESSDENMVV